MLGRKPVRGAIRCSIFFSRPPISAARYPDSAKQVHVLKNTRSVRARKKKMHEIEKSWRSRTVLLDRPSQLPQSAKVPVNLRKRSPNRFSCRRAAKPAWPQVLAESLDLRVLHSIDSFSFFFLGGFIRMPFRPELFLFLLTLTSSITLGQQPAPPRPVSVDDLFGVREVHDPQISPDGRLIAYTVTSTSLKDDKNQTRIWMIPAGGGDAIPLTAEDANSDHPRWSPE